MLAEVVKDEQEFAENSFLFSEGKVEGFQKFADRVKS